MRLGADRAPTLEYAAFLVQAAWASFDSARMREPDGNPDVLRLLSAGLPLHGTPPIDALDEARSVLDHSLAQARPRFLAYVGSSGLEIGAIGDLLAHSYDVNLALDARAATLLEEQTVRWLADFVGYPATAGWFTSGGTVSNLSALAAARERSLPGARTAGVTPGSAAIYCSAEAHYSITRTAEVLGLGSAAVRSIPVALPNRGLDAAELESTIVADLSQGIVPVAVVGTAGTTLTGAVDPLDSIADICSRHGIWFHIDGAYGLPAASTSRASVFSGVDRADSVSIDAHKWMFVPKSCSALLTRHPAALAAAFAHDEAYVPHEGEVPNAVDMTLEYSRPLRALKLWLALRVHGSTQMREAIEGTLDVAGYCYDQARQFDDVQVLPARPTLSTVPLRHIPQNCPDLDGHNRALAAAIQVDGSSYVSPAVIDGEAWLRPCIMNFRTTTRDVDVFLGDVRRLGRRLCGRH
ncbi:MAG: aminotransferase class V-fold PLP-dependent enzyme [Actinomycetales bacterium]|nr:aminotransferase class V-fold PLP-dependent enzyme [Actinomycetales bacterium]